MKLVIVLMLTALPLFCYAGSGCQDLDYVIEKILDPQESKTEFIQDLEEYIPGGITEMALREFKQCFLDQNSETLNNFGVLVVMVASSSRSGCSGRGPVGSQFSTNYFFLSHYFLRCIFIDFREEGRGREREKLQ
ncbi:mammaglobin-B-like isoform X2 [Pipistrellus kuhlii]|uniref:mammaglobin-B-like isoform X2 n=1 Tax=Pipistrellus kuhlii TaxID=59472 RepID=UPI001E27278A|nr:mammaglobin-B-like isoform X2 [Pipistrellus kuhlii]